MSNSPSTLAGTDQQGADKPWQRSRMPRGSEEENAELDDPRRQLVERIAKSEPFQKSSRLPALLRYLADHSLDQNKPGLTEQAIGRNVFDKPKDFSPTEDSGVRVYMRQLRLRLHEYYQSSGQHEPIVVDVPKGGYTLVFHPRAEAAAPVEIEPTEATEPKPSAAAPTVQRTAQRGALLPWLLFAATAVFAVAGWYRVWQVPSAPVPPWPLNQVISKDQQTTVVLADAGYALRLLGDRELTLDDYVRRESLKQLVAKRANTDDARLFGYLESAQITSMADAHASAVLAGLAGQFWKNLSVRSAKELTSSMLTRDNFIFIGAKTSNPWVELYENRLNFRFIEDAPGGARYIQNRAPEQSEERIYSVPGNTGLSGEDYATIALLPNPGGQGTSLLIEGLRLEGTEAAIRFLSNPDQRAELARKLVKANRGVLPTYFEILLHAHSLAGSAVSIDCIAVRPLSS